jgi:hypothetical protein
MCGRVGGGFFEFPHTTTTGVYSRSAVTVARRPVTERQAFHSISSPPLSLSRIWTVHSSHTHTHMSVDKKKKKPMCTCSLFSPPFHLVLRPLSLSLSYLISYLFSFSRGFERCVRSLFDSRLCALFIHTHTHISFFFFTFALLCVCVCVCTMHTCCVGECVYVTPHQNPQVKNTFLPFVKKEKKNIFFFFFFSNSEIWNGWAFWWN